VDGGKLGPPDVTREVNRALGSSHSQFANLLRSHRLWARAELHYSTALALRRREFEQDRTSPAARADLAECLNDRALWLIARDLLRPDRATNEDALQFRDARENYHEALGLREALLKELPGDDRFLRATAATHCALGWLEYRVVETSLIQGRRDLATKHAAPAKSETEAALALYQELQQAHPERLGLRFELAGCYHILCLVTRISGNFAEATRAARSEIDVLEPHLTAHPTAALHYELGLAYDNLAVSLSREDEAYDATPEFDAAFHHVNEAIRTAPLTDYQRLRNQIVHNRGFAARTRRRGDLGNVSPVPGSVRPKR
jgi:hypothetical protein